MNNKLLGYSLAGLISICCICGIAAIGIYYFDNGSLSTPTPQAALPESNFSTIIAQTASAAQTQTIVAMPPAPLSTSTLIPAIDTAPTATIFIFKLQTEVAQPTEYLYSTNTPFALATQTIPPAAGVCSCSGDTLNCGDFATHASAQACFNYCVSVGAGDIHRLDANNDGNACESLP